MFINIIITNKILLCEILINKNKLKQKTKKTKKNRRSRWRGRLARVWHRSVQVLVQSDENVQTTSRTTRAETRRKVQDTDRIARAELSDAARGQEQRVFGGQ